MNEIKLSIPEVWKDVPEVGSWTFGETSLLVGSKARFPCGSDFGALADKVLENSFSIKIPTLSAITTYNRYLVNEHDGSLT